MHSWIMAIFLLLDKYNNWVNMGHFSLRQLPYVWYHSRYLALVFLCFCFLCLCLKSCLLNGIIITVPTVPTDSDHMCTEGLTQLDQYYNAHSSHSDNSGHIRDVRANTQHFFGGVHKDLLIENHYYSAQSIHRHWHGLQA